MMRARETEEPKRLARPGEREQLAPWGLVPGLPQALQRTAANHAVRRVLL